MPMGIPLLAKSTTSKPSTVASVLDSRSLTIRSTLPKHERLTTVVVSQPPPDGGVSSPGLPTVARAHVGKREMISWLRQIEYLLAGSTAASTDLAAGPEITAG
jgi:hypothetical protein